MGKLPVIPVSFVLNYKSTNTYALNVLVGALEAVIDSQVLEVLFVKKTEELAASVRSALNRQRRVVVGWSLHSPGIADNLSDLLRLKGQVDNKEVIYLAGGPHATAEPRSTLKAGFDFVALGEGEQTIVDFVGRLVNAEDYFSTPGIAYVSDGRLRSNGYGKRIQLDDYPPFAQMHRRFNPIEITRGCIYACGFCQTPFMFRAKFRHRSVENIVHYVEVMKDHNLKDIRFITPSSLSYGSVDSSVRLEKIEELLASVRDVVGTEGRIFFGTFPSEVRPEHVSRDALLLVRRFANNNNIIIGGQSGSQRVLDLCRRSHRVEDIVSAVRATLEVGLLPNVDFIFGLPGEEDSDVRATLRLVEELCAMGARIHGHTFIPLPGTPFRNSPAGKIGPAAMRRLRLLASHDKLYGDWLQQIRIAQSLAQHAKKAAVANER